MMNTVLENRGKSAKSSSYK